MIGYRRIFPRFAARSGGREATIAIPRPIDENEGALMIAMMAG